MSTWNMPPGVTTNDIPGNQPEDELRERWLAEFAEHALGVLVDNAMADCSLSDTFETDSGHMATRNQFRAALTTVYWAVPIEQRIEWAHRLDPAVLDYESFYERETDNQ